MPKVKLYEDFERELAPGPGLSAGKDCIVVQYGFPGSGSTFVWQVLDYLCGNAKKTHCCPNYHEYFRVVATVRDFRDVLCTYLTRIGLPPTRESIDFIVSKLGSGPFRELAKMCEVWSDRSNILWLRYEDIADNFSYLFQQAEDFLDMRWSDVDKEHAQREYSLEANLKRSKNAHALCDQTNMGGWLDKSWTQYVIDGINGLHITSGGRVGKWKTIIPEDLHGYVTELLREPLMDFDYPCE